MPPTPQPVRGFVNKQGFPQLDTPLVEPETGIITPPWYRFLISLFSKTGGTLTPINPAVQAPVTVPIVGLSPFIYTAPSDGFVVVFSGEVEISRQGSSFVQVSLVGGAIPVASGDSLRVTWFGPDSPPITFFGTT